MAWDSSQNMGKTLGLPGISNLCPWAVTIVRWAQEKIIYKLDYSLLFDRYSLKKLAGNLSHATPVYWTLNSRLDEGRWGTFRRVKRPSFCWNDCRTFRMSKNCAREGQVNHIDPWPCKEVKNSQLDSEFHAVEFGFQVLDSSLCQWNLDSGFRSLVGYRIPWAVFWIPKPRIPDSISKLFPDSGFQKKKFPDSGFPWMCRNYNNLIEASMYYAS